MQNRLDRLPFGLGYHSMITMVLALTLFQVSDMRWTHLTAQHDVSIIDLSADFVGQQFADRNGSGQA